MAAVAHARVRAAKHAGDWHAQARAAGDHVRYRIAYNRIAGRAGLRQLDLWDFNGADRRPALR